MSKPSTTSIIEKIQSQKSILTYSDIMKLRQHCNEDNPSIAKLLPMFEFIHVPNVGYELKIKDKE